MNVHLLSHIADTVRNWGPLWAYSCFIYETMNGHLKKMFHGTKDMTKQVHHYVLSVILYSLQPKQNMYLLEGWWC